MAILEISEPPTRLAHRAASIAPGVLLCLALTGAAIALQGVEARIFGRAWLEALVLAILLGAAVRTAWTPGARWRGGIHFSGKFILEVAVVLLGAGVDVHSISAAGGPLLAGIAALVVLAIGGSYGLGRLFGLPRRMAVLIACGNSICGNSAIAAVAPVIGAESEDVAAAISFTAVLGVAVVLGLPILGAGLSLSARGYGIMAGLTVYAVPQVLAAAAPLGALAVQVGTLVKLVRVL
ncbi:MAG: putative sulfate exporter family transporter, partial [Caulobacteraceae bacterium]|nr:putative sulfate exporter family transporter [Caulobacteraceae bacterium]